MQLQLPERYADDMSLKDRLFYGMHQHMKDSLQYLYTKPETSYADLLKAGYAAEIESVKGRALLSKAAALRQEETVATNQGKTDSTSKQVDQMVTKIEGLTTIVKSAQYSGSKKNAQKGQKSSQSAPGTPAKSKSANQSNEWEKYVKKLPQCWCCGGWGHVISECPSTGNEKWQELSDLVEGKPPSSKAQGAANLQK